MRPEQPEIARPADRVDRRLGDFVLALASIALVAEPGEQPVQLVVVEAGQAEIEALALQITEFEPEQRLVPLGVLARPVVHQPVGPRLRRRQAASDVHRRGCKAELPRRL